MLYYIFIAILAGIIIGLSRGINSQLSMGVGVFKASFWNHIVGMVFLTFVLLATHETQNWSWSTLHMLPFFSYLGGFFGALFVAVNSYVFSRLGAMKTIILVISGQMISSVIIDYHGGSLFSIIAQLLGIAFIVFGMYFSKKK